MWEYRLEQLRSWVQEQVGQLPATNMLEMTRRCSGDEEVVMEPGDLRLRLRLRRSDKDYLIPKIESSGANQMHDPCRSGLTSNSFSSTQFFFLLFLLLLLLLLPSSIFQTLRVVLTLFQHPNRPSFNGCLYTSSNLPASFQSFFGFEPLTVSIQLPAAPIPTTSTYINTP